MIAVFLTKVLPLKLPIVAYCSIIGLDVYKRQIYPTWAETISTMASAGETMAGITGIYITMFIAIPLADKLYRILEPKLGRFALKEKKEEKAA